MPEGFDLYLNGEVIPSRNVVLTDGLVTGFSVIELAACNYDIVVTAVCWTGGWNNLACIHCGYEDLINWYKALGHSYGAPEPVNALWNIVYCERPDCGHSEYMAAIRYGA